MLILIPHGLVAEKNNRCLTIGAAQTQSCLSGKWLTAGLINSTDNLIKPKKYLEPTWELADINKCKPKTKSDYRPSESLMAIKSITVSITSTWMNDDSLYKYVYNARLCPTWRWNMREQNRRCFLLISRARHEIASVTYLIPLLFLYGIPWHWSWSSESMRPGDQTRHMKRDSCYLIAKSLIMITREMRLQKWLSKHGDNKKWNFLSS